MKIGVIGTGAVGQTLSSKLLELNHDVMIGTRNVSEKLANNTKEKDGNPSFSEWLKANSKAKLGTFAEAAAFGEIIINASNGSNSVKALILSGSKNLRGKVLIDVANPLDFSNGMPPSLLLGLNNTNSLAEEIQKTFPDVQVVKTLNTMWAGLMVNPNLIGNGDHVNFICGNSTQAKSKVQKILNQFGWKNENIMDLGDLTGARATESVLHIWLRIMSATQNGVFNFRIIR
jgi:8-hydroxy-5-deazaflavin:NADPH oxidoreductase